MTYFTNFKCHEYTNTFDIMFKISSIGSITDNIESTIDYHPISCKCKSCGSTTAIFESLAVQFETVPVVFYSSKSIET